MKKLLAAVFMLAAFVVQAQDQTIKDLSKDTKVTIKKPEDTLQKLWRKGGLYSLNISQGSLTNWAAGGDEFSLAVSSILNLYGFYKKGKHSWDNTLDFNLGYVRTTSLGSRKNDDRIDLLSIYGRFVAPKWNLSGLLNFRSQLFKGYTYKNNVKSFSSAFLSPGYLLGS